MFRQSGDYEERSFIIEAGELVFNLMVLDVLWIFCSLPIVTVGASTAALNYTCIKLRLDEGDSVIKMFFRSFVQNIRQGAVLGTGMLAVLIILTAFLIQMLGGINAGHTYDIFAAIFVVVAIMIWFVLFTYLFMTLARFDNPIQRTITNAVYFAVSDVGTMLKVLWIVMMMVIMVPLALWIYFPYGFPFVIFFGMPTTAYILAKIFNQLFEKQIEASQNRK